ncbi:MULTISPECIES: hypothetical protein [unclassified Bradyrhizobium]|uniref:hypothetical protein n=1 Tax=unclassified Bradyrhizobium TaxID=2631580 RepID=UPI001FF77B8F|nr:MULTISPECIES: hypothetical protein [unclassified Bradyrhizobium]MCK1329874.1 hypothetical protein [Bradyrhizobium sp. CW9]MCK1633935.1 hypothetical protein [Bradyrhizobium sp. 162]MCK1699041.1 hypothetical protein [Bradyrhizobium sp. 144]
MPQHILGEENLGALAPQNAGDACFWIAAMGIVDGEVRDKKKTVNTLCGVAGREELYTVEAPDAAIPNRIRPDQFYGQALATAVRTILEMRKQQNLGAATINEIFDALTTGGYTFNTKNDDVARQSLRNSLSKNTITFHKLPNGRFGMLSWYPNAKPARPVNLTAVGLGAAALPTEEEEEEETETATEESAAEDVFK